MPDYSVQIHAFIPHELKVRVFVKLAQREQTFSDLIRKQLERWVNEQENRVSQLGEGNVSDYPQGI